MVIQKTNEVLVVVQLSGGNDFMNTVVPYTDHSYYDFRSNLAIPEESILSIDSELGFPEFARSFFTEYQNGKMAIVQGIGYPNSSRSHFRGMADEGWLGKTVRDLDPQKENPLTAVSIGQGLPRALSAKDVTITSVADLDNYGLMSDLDDMDTKHQTLNAFKNI